MRAHDLNKARKLGEFYGYNCSAYTHKFTNKATQAAFDKGYRDGVARSNQEIRDRAARGDPWARLAIALTMFGAD